MKRVGLVENFTTAFVTWLFVLQVAAGQESQRSCLREDFREIPAEIPITQNHIVNADLTLHLYGTSANLIKKSHHDEPADDPYYVWSGLCTGTWGFTFSPHSGKFDLSTGGTLRWRSRQSGEHYPRILIRLENGGFFVSDQSDTGGTDWHLWEFDLVETTWTSVNIDTFSLDKNNKTPDLARVTEIGVTDLKPGRESEHCSRIDWIEICR
jgi:hypothetical protein